MNKVLVAYVGDSKLYYIIGTKPGQKDGLLVDANGKSREVNIFSYLAKTSGITKIAASPFHKFFWDGDSSPDKRTTWKEIFVLKIEDIPKEMLDGVVPSDGKSQKKKIVVDRKAADFINGDARIPVKGGLISSKMIKSAVLRSVDMRRN